MMRTNPALARGALAAALALAMARGAIAQDGPGIVPEKPTPRTDLTCGPRCVQGVLCLYGRRQEDLLDLVREIQWPDLEKGATLRSISEAFRKRGLYTHAMTIGRGQRLRWPHPVVVHMKGGEGGGHYVVWMPSESGDFEKVWGGVSGGWTFVPSGRFARERSGVVLLTSPVPITHPASAAEDAGGAFVPIGWLVVVVLGCVLIRGMFSAKGSARPSIAASTLAPSGSKDANAV